MRTTLSMILWFVVLLIILVFVVMPPGPSIYSTPLTAARTSVAPKQIVATAAVTTTASAKPVTKGSSKKKTRPPAERAKGVDSEAQKRKRCDRYLNNVALANSVSDATNIGNDTLYGMLLSTFVNMNAERDAELEINPTLVERLNLDPTEEPFTGVIKRLQEIGHKHGWTLRYSFLLLKYNESDLEKLWNRLADGHGLIEDREWLKHYQVGSSRVWLVDYDQVFWSTGSESKVYFKEFCSRLVAMQ